MLPTPTTQVGERYVVQLKLDMGDTVVVLPLDSIIFAQADIDSGNAFTVPFDLSEFDINGVMGYIVEVFLDAAIADVEVGVANGSLTDGLPPTDIVMNVGSGGLAGFDIELTIESNKALTSRVSYPLHIGITESGYGEEGRIRSLVGLGILLLNGIGDTIRMSLTAPDRVENIRLCADLLEELGIAYV